MTVPDSTFSFLPLLKLSPSEARARYYSSIFRRCLMALEEERIQRMDGDFDM
jgi:hypothetical protein